tara:strand:- start:3503 stop:3733 length:231 start_codon:yes stop_codon:yes gene_type:complete
MSWEKIIKDDFKDIDSFIKRMKQINISAMNEFKEFNTKTSGEFNSMEMQDLATTIIDMAESIKTLEKMRNMQEELQ